MCILCSMCSYVFQLKIINHISYYLLKLNVAGPFISQKFERLERCKVRSLLVTRAQVTVSIWAPKLTVKHWWGRGNVLGAVPLLLCPLFLTFFISIRWRTFMCFTIQIDEHGYSALTPPSFLPMFLTHIPSLSFITLKKKTL